MLNPETDDRADLPRRKISELRSGQCAVYYRDRHEGVWVKFDRTSHFPASFEPGKWTRTGDNEPLDPDETVSIIQNIEDLTGVAFTVAIPEDKSLDQLRAEAFAEYGHEVHIRYTVGPTSAKTIGNDGCAFDIPLTRVDDPFLSGSMSFPILKPGIVLVVGYFK